MNGSAGAEDSATVPTDPKFNPGSGQTNPGVEEQAPSQSSEIINIPTPEESLRALMTPVSKQPSTGETSSTPRPEATTSAGSKEHQESQNAAAGPPGVTTAGSAPGSNSAGSDRRSTSAKTTESATSGEPPPSGPIGSVGETIPAKFSKRNDILDRTPIMALLLPLSDQQRRQIYEAVMAEKSQPVAGADALKPASELSPNQALNSMRPLPESVCGIDGVSRLYYIKAKDKVLLIEPNVRTVVGQITASY
jgi:hypothetical protein